MYEANVVFMAKSKNDEFVLDELDEDYITITPLEPLVTVRTTNRGNVNGSAIPAVPYEIKVTIPPESARIRQAQNFINKWKQTKKPKLKITIKQVIDEETWVLNFEQGFFTTNLDQDVAGSKVLPKFTFTLTATGNGMEEA